MAVGEEAHIAIRPGLSSQLSQTCYSPKLVKSFPLGYSFCFYKTARTIEKGEAWGGGGEAGRWPFTDCVHINQQQFPKPALGDMIQFPPETLRSSSSSYTPWRALSPSPPFQEEYLLKGSCWAIYNFLKRCTMLRWRGNTKAQYPAMPQANPCFPAVDQRGPAMAQGHQIGKPRAASRGRNTWAEMWRQNSYRKGGRGVLHRGNCVWQRPVRVGTWASKGAEQGLVAGKCKDDAR